MRKAILLALGFLVGIIACFYLFSQGEDVVHYQAPVLKLEGSRQRSVPAFDSINARNSQIRNLACSLRTVAQMPGKRAVKLSGFLSYEKERKFRLELDSFLGPELDIGSDGTQFWFWSGRMKNPGLYWSTYDNFYKTRLKTPFNPLWLSQCLGIDQIDYSDAIVDTSGSRWRVIKKSMNAKREPITTVTYVDPQRLLITGHGVYDQSNRLEASSEVEEFNGAVPSKISFIWHKENASMVWYLDGVTENTVIDARKWVMPNINPKIDMSRD